MSIVKYTFIITAKSIYIAHNMVGIVQHSPANGEFLDSYIDIGTENLALDLKDITQCQKVYLKIAITCQKET